ncbi:hypothetical protein D9M71_350320 [compost metagenome]
MKGHRGLGGGLRVEFGGEADLEQDVLHHVAAEVLGEAEVAQLCRLGIEVLAGVAERDVVGAPLRRGQRAGNAHLAAQSDIGQAYATAGGISRRPRLARAGVRRVAIGTQGVAVDEGVGEGGEHLLTAGAHQPGADGGAGQFDQEHMVQADAVEGVLQGEHTLYLVGHDHGVQHCAHGQWRFAVGDALLRQVIGHGEDAAEVVRRVAPFGGQPGVVEIQPAHHGADVPGGLDRIEAETGAGDARAVRYHGAFDDGPEVLGAFREAQRQQTAAEGVHQAVAGGVERFGGFDLVAEDVAGDVLDDLVVVGADVEVDVGAHRCLRSRGLPSP